MSENSCYDKMRSNSDLNDFLSSLSNESSNEDGTYYFETDYLALKSNPDYLKLMKTLAVLEIQRIRTCKDIEKIENLRIRVKEDPSSVMKDILSGDVNLNTRGKIEKIPDIDWTKYKHLSFDGRLPAMTRKRSKKLTEDPPPEKFLEAVPSTSSGELLVRGRKYDQNKPETFNQLWTVEEQLRLESLLEEFPPEPIEWRRWEKISNALGNRTPKQVCSRVQKYFRKLRQVGVAVPGKVRSVNVSKPRLVHRRNKHLLYRPTTFFPGVAMGEMDEESDGESSECHPEPNMSHWVDILDTIKQEKAKMDESGYSPVLHYGYKCMECREEPIRGVRWECRTCQEVCTSSCSDCLVSLISSAEPCHPVAHVFQPSRLYTNPQYSVQAFSTHNYLDPNYTA